MRTAPHLGTPRLVFALLIAALFVPLQRCRAATVAVVTKAGTPVVDLTSTGLFSAGQITVLEPQGATPTLLNEQDEPLYDAVLVYSNAGFNDPVSLGDVLADYVDAGGGVVLAAFCFTNMVGDLRVAGRILDGPDYSPFLPASTPVGSPGMIEWPPLVDCHPVFDGLTEAPTYLSVGTFGNPVLGEGAVLLARTESGDSLIASNAPATVIAVNAHPNESTIYNDAGVRLFANALLLVAGGGIEDCNFNAVPDSCDISEGTSGDCQPNGVPDECEIIDLLVEDCNQNDIPDECELDDGSEPDCNNNGVPDVCEIDTAGGAPGGPFYCSDNCDPDCNDNGIPDGCELEDPDACDCNRNAVDDATDIADGTSTDCNANGVPDECETTGTVSEEIDLSATPALPIPDAATVEDTITASETGTVLDLDVELDISHTWDHDLTVSLTHNQSTVVLIQQRGGAGWNFTGTVLDDEAEQSIADGSAPFSGSFRPEESLAAFDGDDVGGDWTLRITDATAPDDGTLNAWTLHLDVERVFSQDCNDNGTIDTCDIAEGTSADLNANGIPDDCEEDCNLNGVPDELDLSAGTSADCNGNDVPDECDRRADPSIDCNDNLIPDECDIAAGTSSDVNGDEVPDECVRPCSCGDLDGDGSVDLLDFTLFVYCFNATDPNDPPQNCPLELFMCADLSGDMEINLSDFATFAQVFGAPPDNDSCNW